MNIVLIDDILRAISRGRGRLEEWELSETKGYVVTIKVLISLENFAIASPDSESHDAVDSGVANRALRRIEKELFRKIQGSNVNVLYTDEKVLERSRKK